MVLEIVAIKIEAKKKMCV